MDNEQKQFQCTGDCLRCMAVQRQYCASQHSYNNMRMIERMQESINALSASMEELKEMIRALPEGMVLSVALEKEGGDGDKKGFQA